MPNRRPVVLRIWAAAAIAFAVLSVRQALSWPDTLGTEVVLAVERIAAPAGRVAATPQYMCSAKLQRFNGEILAQPRIVVLEGVPASVTSATESGSKVVLKVLVSGSNSASYEIDITSAGGESEHHRSTISLPK